MSFTFSFGLIPLAIPVLISGLLAWYTFRYRATTGALPFAFLMLALIEWSTAYILALAGTDLPTKFFWLAVSYGGVVVTPVFWFAFALEYTDRKTWLTPFRMALLSILPMITMTVIITNNAYHLFWTNQKIVQEGQFLVLATENGPWFWVHAAYSYLLLLFGAILIVRTLLRWPPQYRGQMLWILLAIAAPWLANIVSVFGLIPISIDLTPFAFTITGIGLAYALFRHRLLDLSPIARDVVIDGIKDGMIVLDAAARIVDMNPAARRMLGLEEAHQPIGKQLAEILAPWPHLVERYRDVTEAQDEISIGEGDSKRWYELNFSPLREMQTRLIGQVIIARDITDRKRAEEQIQLQAVALASAANAIIITDTKGIIQWVNPAFSELTGYSAEDAIGQSPNLLKSGKHDRAFYQLLWGTLQAGEVWHGEVTNRRKDGSLYVEEQTVTPVQNEQGEIFRYIAVKQDITERKRTDERIDQLLRQQEIILDNIPVGVIFQKERNIVWANKAIAEMSGYSVDEVKTLEALMYHESPESLQRFAAFLENELKSGAPASIEAPFKRKDGSIFWCDVIGQAINPQNIRGDGILWVAQDITAKRQAEAQIRQLSRAVESSPASIVITDPDGKIQYVNPKFSQVTGYSLAEVLGKNPRILKTEFIPPETHKELWQTISAGQEWSGEFCNRKKNGELYWELASISPITDAAGRITHYVAVKEDITEQRQVREQLHLQNLQLQESEARFRQIVENASDIIYRTDAQGHFIYVNPTALYAGGFASDSEMLGRHFLELAHPDWRNKVNRFYSLQFMRQEPSSYFEFPIVSRDGREIWLGQNVQIIKDGENVVGFQALARDITELKRTQDALALSRDQALEASRLKSQLLAKVSHELRTPLGGIIGYAELLQLGTFGPLNEEQKQASVYIVESADYLDKMINELLDQAQIEARTIILRKETFSPAALLQKVETSMLVLAHDKGLGFITSITDDVPEKLVGDERRLQQILINLAGNAIKYTRLGHVRIRLYRPDPAHWAMEVSDTGAGIPKEAQAYIFEPFRQVDNSITRENRGTGLGLSITKQLVELMDGQISVASEVDLGSTFTVTLPIVD